MTRHDFTKARAQLTSQSFHLHNEKSHRCQGHDIATYQLIGGGGGTLLIRRRCNGGDVCNREQEGGGGGGLRRKGEE
jgi:hypothetical protein